MKVIKRYTNRKYYDIDESRYVTLHYITNLVREDIPFVVLNHTTAENLTNYALKQVMYDQLTTTELPDETLKDYIRVGYIGGVR